MVTPQDFETLRAAKEELLKKVAALQDEYVKNMQKLTRQVEKNRTAYLKGKLGLNN